jgi:hypothetical protein
LCTCCRSKSSTTLDSSFFFTFFLTLLLYFYSSNKSDLFSMYQPIKNQMPLLPSLISSSLRLTSKFQFFSKPLIGFLRPVLTRPLSGSPRRLRASFCIPGSALRCAPVSLQNSPVVKSTPYT